MKSDRPYPAHNPHGYNGTADIRRTPCPALVKCGYEVTTLNQWVRIMPKTVFDGIFTYSRKTGRAPQAHGTTTLSLVVGSEKLKAN